MNRRFAATTAVLVLAVVLGPATPASAHATLVGTVPADGSHLDRGPAQVTFTLNEPVSVVTGSPQVIDQDGRRYPVARAVLGADHTVLTVRLAAALPDGSFLATARLVSPDTHVVSVSAAFTAGTAKGLLTASATGGGDQVATYAAKLLVYAGAVLAAGIPLTTALLWPELRSRRRWRALVRWGSVALVAGLGGRLALVAADRAGGITHLSAETIGAVARSGFGIAALVAIVVAIVQAVRPRAGWVAAAATVAAVAFGGHGADPARFPLPLVLTLLHVYAVLAWIGGVVVVAVLLRRSVPLRTWHRYALAHVAVVAATGAALGLVRIPAAAALITTTYGLALAGKTVLVGLAVIVAGLVHRRLARDAGGLRLLSAELLLVTCVFGATGVLSSVAPATASYDPPVHTTVDFGGGSVLGVTIPSTRRGPQRLIVEAAGRDASTVSVDLSSSQANVARLPVRFGGGERTASGLRWDSRDLVVPATGTWQVTITFDTPDGPRVASFHYDVL